MTRTLHAIISGKVQGVFFRIGVQTHAQNLGLTGFVRNLNDGKLEVVVQGDDAGIDDLKGYLLQGPSMARVEHVETKWVDYDKAFPTFDIL